LDDTVQSGRNLLPLQKKALSPFNMKMKVIRFSEVLVNFYQATRRHIPGQRHNQLRENLKFATE
jgi:hypothetical protein